MAVYSVAMPCRHCGPCCATQGLATRLLPLRSPQLHSPYPMLICNAPGPCPQPRPLPKPRQIQHAVSHDVPSQASYLQDSVAVPQEVVEAVVLAAVRHAWVPQLDQLVIAVGTHRRCTIRTSVEVWVWRSWFSDPVHAARVPFEGRWARGGGGGCGGTPPLGGPEFLRGLFFDRGN